MKPTTDEVLKWARETDDELIMAGMIGTREQYAQILSNLAYAAGAEAMKERAAKVCEEVENEMQSGKRTKQGDHAAFTAGVLSERIRALVDDDV